MNYHNTTHESGQNLINYEKETHRQERELMKLFAIYNEMSPRQIEAITGWPRTSIARSLRNLVLAEKLIKLPLSKKSAIGNYGRSEHIWRVAE